MLSESLIVTAIKISRDPIRYEKMSGDQLDFIENLNSKGGKTWKNKEARGAKNVSGVN